MSNIVFTIFSLVVALMIGYIVWQLMQPEEIPEKKPRQVQPEHTKKSKKKKRQHKVDKTAIYQNKKKPEKEKAHLDSHLLSLVFRGHKNAIDGLSVRADKRMMVSVSNDSDMRVWVVTEGSKEHPYKLINLPESGSACSFSPDGTTICVALRGLLKRKLQFWKCKLKKEKRTKREIAWVSSEPIRTFDTSHTSDITSVEWGPSGSYVVTCARGQDTHINLWSPQGERLFELNSNQLQNNMAALSPDGRFLAAATRLADSKVWELHSSGAGVAKVTHAMSLRHQKEVKYLSFAANRVATISGRSWRVFDVDVRFIVGEDPKLLVEMEVDEQYEVDMIEMSPDGSVVALGAGTSLLLYDVETKTALANISVSRRGRVTQMQFSRDGLLLAVAGGSKEIKMFNVPYAAGHPRTLISNKTQHIQEPAPAAETKKTKSKARGRKGKGKKKAGKKQ